jgi:hypothetical protein
LPGTSEWLDGWLEPLAWLGGITVAAPAVLGGLLLAARRLGDDGATGSGDAAGEGEEEDDR